MVISFSTDLIIAEESKRRERYFIVSVQFAMNQMKKIQKFLIVKEKRMWVQLKQTNEILIRELGIPFNKPPPILSLMKLNLFLYQ